MFFVKCVNMQERIPSGSSFGVGHHQPQLHMDTYTFGGPSGSCYFKDVTIVNDTDIWAVGEIYATPDTIYNAVHWDGNKWNLKKIMFPLCDINGNQQGSGPYPGDGIFAYSPNDIWFSCDVSLVHWNGHDFTPACMQLGYGQRNLGKMWGINGEIYLSGTNGFFAKYSNNLWTKMESGTTIDLRDVWGTQDGSVVWACGYSNDNSQSVLLKYDGTSWTTVWSSHPSAPPYGGLIESLWGDEHLYLAGTDGVYKQDVTGETNIQHLFTLTHFPYRIKGSAENNIAFVGDNGMIYHYNGSTWKLLNISELDQPLYSVAVSTNLIIAVGSDYTIGFGAALIYLGKRNSN